jgi:hypothetical protein
VLFEDLHRIDSESQAALGYVYAWLGRVGEGVGCLSGRGGDSREASVDLTTRRHRFLQRPAPWRPVWPVNDDGWIERCEVFDHRGTRLSP